MMLDDTDFTYFFVKTYMFLYVVTCVLLVIHFYKCQLDNGENGLVRACDTA